MWRRQGLYFDPGAPAADPATPPAPAANPSPETLNPTGQGEQTIPLSRFNEINNELKRIKREQEAATEAQRVREEAEAAKRGEFETLASQRAEQIRDLEPFKVKATRYETALNAHLETQRKDLPAHITALLDKLDPVEQLEWIAANREAIGTPTVATPPRPGNGPSPKPSGGNTEADAVKRSREQLALTGNYAGTF